MIKQPSINVIRSLDTYTIPYWEESVWKSNSNSYSAVISTCFDSNRYVEYRICWKYDYLISILISTLILIVIGFKFLKR